MFNRIILCLIILMCASACGVHVQRQFLHPTYDQKYRENLIRLALYVEAPLKAGEESDLILQLWALQSQKYINQHRDFLVKVLSASSVDTQLKLEQIALKDKDLNEICQGEADQEGGALQGMIYLKGMMQTVDVHSKAFKVHMQAELRTCGSKEILWQAQVEDEWPVQDANVTAIIQNYQTELGTSIKPYIAPSFHAIRYLFDLLPYPKLISDSDIQEKIKLQ